MSKYVIDLTGKTFGQLTALNQIGREKFGGVIWQCQCSCGNIVNVLSSNLIKGNSKTCGCSRLISKRKTHGCSTKTNAEYRAWANMKTRCYNEKATRFKNHGGRGIIVCDRWINSFENFLLDMGKKPSKEYSLERIDNDGNYTIQNCKWATPKEQSNNTRRNNIITYNCVKKTFTQWSSYFKIHPESFRRYLKSHSLVETMQHYENKLLLG